MEPVLRPYIGLFSGKIDGEGAGIRTRDTRIKSPLLYHLSYAPIDSKYNRASPAPDRCLT